MNFLNLPKRIRNLYSQVFADLDRYVLPRFGFCRPWEINALANDICNSRCQMCLIWEQKRTRELSPAEWGKLFGDKFFSRVKYVGFTGGEPTLRSDLPEIFRATAKALPHLKGLSMITNAIRERDVLARVEDCAAVCREAGLGFSVMVSLDGLGAVHDQVRGRPGNFESAVRCIEYFSQAGFATSFGCTITKTNLEYVDDLLDQVIEKGWYGRFRIAEFIKRLYNESQGAFIRNFDDLERYHLALFFYRLENEFEPNPIYRKTYRSIRGMLYEDQPRRTGCPYQGRAVVLTSKGEMLYCAPKSKVIGSLVEPGADAGKIYRFNSDELKRIRREHCDECIHDYHVPPTVFDRLSEKLAKRRFRQHYDRRVLLRKARQQAAAAKTTGNKTIRHVLIVGWYGTETIGDKAILDTIIRELLARQTPPQRIYLSSLYPFISRRTLVELGFPQVEIVETYSKDFEASCRIADEIVIGGGPLMHIEPLDHMVYAFTEGRRHGALTRVEGCGLGPLNAEWACDLVGEIIRLANIIRLRDQKSATFCLERFGRSSEVINDPAVQHVRRCLSEGLATLRKTQRDEVFQIECFFRDITYEYEDQGGQNFFEKRNAVRAQLLSLVKGLLGFENVQVTLRAMHCFSVGGDDRALARWLERQLAASNPDLAGRLRIKRLPEPTTGIIQAMAEADFCLCMRFHSVVFATEVGVPFAAIDYTHGGKIEAFLKARDQMKRLIKIEDLGTGTVLPILEAAGFGDIFGNKLA